MREGVVPLISSLIPEFPRMGESVPEVFEVVGVSLGEWR